MVLFLVAQTTKSLSLSSLKNTLFFHVLSSQTGDQVTTTTIAQLLPRSADNSDVLIKKFMDNATQVEDAIVHKMIAKLQTKIRQDCHKEI